MGLVTAVTELAGDGESVLAMSLGGLEVARRRGAVEEINVMRAVLDAVAKNVDHASLGDLALKASEELLASRTGVPQVKGVDEVGLRGIQECGKLG